MPPLFETLRWTASGAEYQAVSTQPSACLAFDPAIAPTVQAGHALFNTPTLLGGQAAKAGLNCASCHVNGRGNAHFVQAGVSSAPGTADVSNSFFSAARGNGKFDPVAIPDLALPGKISRNPADQALERSIRELIVEEFAGAEPSDTTIKSLAAYVRAIRPCEKDDNIPAPRSLADQMTIIDAGMTAAKASSASADGKADVTVLLAAVRHQLGLISERYAGPKLSKERQALLNASRQLKDIGEMDDTAGMTVSLTKWSKTFEKQTAPALTKKERQSLYNKELLAKMFLKQSEKPSQN